jgi:hypothetical protein
MMTNNLFVSTEELIAINNVWLALKEKSTRFDASLVYDLSRRKLAR